jgi:hypothetical protein
MFTRANTLAKGSHCGIVFSLFVFVQAWSFFAKHSDAIFSDFAVSYCLETAVPISIGSLLLLWCVREYRRNKLPLKMDKKTKAMTYAELAVSITGISIFAIAAITMSLFDFSNPDLAKSFNKRIIPHPYSGLSFELYLLGYLFLGISAVLYYALLPKQMADEVSIVPRQAL